MSVTRFLLCLLRAVQSYSSPSLLFGADFIVLIDGIASNYRKGWNKLWLQTPDFIPSPFGFYIFHAKLSCSVCVLWPLWWDMSYNSKQDCGLEEPAAVALPYLTWKSRQGHGKRLPGAVQGAFAVWAPHMLTLKPQTLGTGGPIITQPDLTNIRFDFLIQK